MTTDVMNERIRDGREGALGAEESRGTEMGSVTRLKNWQTKQGKFMACSPKLRRALRRRGVVTFVRRVGWGVGLGGRRGPPRPSPSPVRFKSERDESLTECPSWFGA